MDTVEQQKSAGLTSTFNPRTYAESRIRGLKTIWGDFLSVLALQSIEKEIEEAAREGMRQIPPPFPPDAQKIRDMEKRITLLEGLNREYRAENKEMQERWAASGNEERDFTLVQQYERKFANLSFLHDRILELEQQERYWKIRAEAAETTLQKREENESREILKATAARFGNRVYGY